jgi:hypothetical protein
MKLCSNTALNVNAKNSIYYESVIHYHAMKIIYNVQAGLDLDMQDTLNLGNQWI